MAQILAHNLKPAATWGSGGASYDTVSQSIADAIDHVVNRIWPQPGERILTLRQARAGLRGGYLIEAQR